MGEKENNEQEQAACALSKHLTFRIDGELARDLAARAAAEDIEGRRLSRFYRLLLRAGLAGGWTAMPKVAAELKRLRADLARIGGNLNQVAFWINTEGHVKEKELTAAIEALRPMLSECTEAVIEVRNGILRRTR